MHLHHLAKEIREAVERGHLAFAVRLLCEHVISVSKKENDMATEADLQASLTQLQAAAQNVVPAAQLDPIKTGIDAVTTSLGGTPPPAAPTPAAA